MVNRLTKVDVQVKAPSWQLRSWPQPQTAIALFLLLAGGIILALLPLTLAILVVLCIIALVLIVIKPECALYLLVFAIPFGSVRSLEISGFNVTAVEILVAVLVLAWTAQQMAKRELKPKVSLLLLPLLLVLSALAFLTTIAPSVSLSLKELLKWVELVVVFYLVAHMVERPIQVKLLLIAILCAAFLEALHGWYQFLGEVGPSGFLLGGSYIRAHGTFEQPNPYAGYLGLTLPFCYSLLVGRARVRPTKGIALVSLAFVVILAALLVSFSRGAWLAFASAVLIISLVRTRRIMAPTLFISLLVALILLLGAFNLLPAPLADRLSSTTDYFRLFDASKMVVTTENWAIAERMATWQAAWGMFSDHTWNGVGLGGFRSAYGDYALPYWRNVLPDHAHNYYLNLLAETGVLGLVVYLVFFLAVFVYAGSSLWGTEWSKVGLSSSALFNSPAITLGILGSLAALSIHSLFDNLYVHGIGVQLGMLLGLLVAVNRRVRWSEE